MQKNNRCDEAGKTNNMANAGILRTYTNRLISECLSSSLHEKLALAHKELRRLMQREFTSHPIDDL